MKVIKKLVLSATAFGILLCLTACAPKLTGISVNSDEKLEKGQTLQLLPTYTFHETLEQSAYDAAVNKMTVTYTSSDESVVTVDAAGIITAVDGGKTVVTATAGKDISATCNVTVTVPVDSVEAPKSIDLQTNGGAEAALGAKVLPANATNKDIAYTSDNEEVATVDKTGKVTAVGKGEAVITSTVGGKTAKTTVNVTVKITDITLESEAGWIYVGGSARVKAYIFPVEADATTYTYSSDNTKVATVSESGTMVGKAAGTAKITVTGAGYSKIYTLTVKTKPAPKPTQKSVGVASGGTAGGGSSGAGGASGGAAPSAPAPALAVDVGGAIAAGIGYGQSLGASYVPGCGGNMYGNIVAELSPDLAGDICSAVGFAASFGDPSYMNFDITYDGTSVCVWFC